MFKSASSKGSIRTRGVLAAALLSAVALTCSAAEQDESKGWFVPAGTPAKNVYFGLGAALTDSKSPGSNQDGSVTNVATDGRDLGVRLVAGYQINEHVSAELNYSDFGKTDFQGTSSGGDSWLAGPVRATNEMSAVEVGMWGRWPIAPQWYAIGYLGWSRWKSTETFTEGSIVTVDEDKGGDVAYAAGLEFDIGRPDRVLYRFDVGQRKVDDERMLAATAQIIYRFP